MESCGLVGRYHQPPAPYLPNGPEETEPKPDDGIEGTENECQYAGCEMRGQRHRFRLFLIGISTASCTLVPAVLLRRSLPPRRTNE